MKPGLSVRPTALGHGPPRDARFLGSVTEEADREPTSSRPQPREKDSSPHCFLRGTSMPSYSITTSKNNCSSNLSLAPCSSWIMPPFTKLGKPGNSLRKADTNYSFFLPILPISTRLKNTSQTSKKFALISRQTLLLTTLFDCTDINDFYYKKAWIVGLEGVPTVGRFDHDCDFAQFRFHCV